MTKNLKKTTLFEHQRTQTFSEEYSFTRPDGAKTSIVVPRSIARDVRQFTARLLDAGAVLPNAPESARRVLAAAVNATPSNSYVYAARTGWRPQREAFVLQNKLIGSSPTTFIGIDGSNLSGGRGTISAAFAAPLMDPIGEGSFGICLFGKSRGGKTLATLAAGSVIGLGSEDQLPNWYSTIAGLEPLLPAFNDSVFPIDDLSKMVARTDHERYLAVRDLAYKFIEGTRTE
jgi:hypothetical protein